MHLETDSWSVTATYRRLTSEPNKQFFGYSADERTLNISTKQNIAIFKRSLTRYWTQNVYPSFYAAFIWHIAYANKN